MPPDSDLIRRNTTTPAGATVALRAKLLVALAILLVGLMIVLS